MLLCCVTSFFGRKGKKDGVVALLWLGIVSSYDDEVNILVYDVQKIKVFVLSPW